ncbi:MAG TPA: efflux RND transporter periplasmic adaptor subunit [Nitrospiraceae bacterium]|nr:efflux RND transporter periplasmic adaptor subunit [Nitrospiraceae bacterium]
MASMTKQAFRWIGFIGSVWAAVFAATSVSAGVDLPCLVKPRVVVAVGSPIPGLLTQLSVDQGDGVREGQVLATLESSLEQTEVDVAKAKAEMEAAITSTQVKAEFSNRKAGRARNLTTSSAIASNEFDEAETEQRVMEAAHLEALENKVLAQRQLARAEAALALRTIRSPIAGLVIERYVSPGELVKEKPILQLAQLDPLQVEVLAPVSWLGKFTVGMPIDVKLSHGLPASHRARVTVINPIVDSASDTFRVRLELPNPQYRIPAGVACTARLAPQ